MLLWQDSRLILVAAEISLFGRFFVSLRARALYSLSCAHVCHKNILLLQNADVLSECSERPYFERESILSFQLCLSTFFALDLEKDEDNVCGEISEK